MLQWHIRDWSTEDADEELRKLTHLDGVSSLYLSSNNMTSIPLAVTLLHNLEWLYLGANQIVELPAFLSQLTALRVLDCCKNRLSLVSPEISHLVNLKRLYLSHNSLSSLPGSLVKLTNLDTLHLGSNKQLPEHLQKDTWTTYTPTQSLLHQIALFQYQPHAARATFQWLLIWKHHLRCPEGMWCIPRDVAHIIAHMVFDSRASTVWQRLCTEEKKSRAEKQGKN